MSSVRRSSIRVLAAACILAGSGACTRAPGNTAVPAAQAAGCLAAGDGELAAQLRGALVADLGWKNAEMECDGGTHPDGEGLRITISGPLPGSSSRLRFIFGIDPHDKASGVAQAFPVNLTLLVEGDSQLYATRGSENCAAETLQRTALAHRDGGLERVQVRGYCIGPASDLAGTARVLVPTFSFTALLRTGDLP